MQYQQWGESRRTKGWGFKRVSARVKGWGKGQRGSWEEWFDKSKRLKSRWRKTERSLQEIWLIKRITVIARASLDKSRRCIRNIMRRVWSMNREKRKEERRRGVENACDRDNWENYSSHNPKSVMRISYWVIYFWNLKIYQLIKHIMQVIQAHNPHNPHYHPSRLST